MSAMPVSENSLFIIDNGITKREFQTFPNGLFALDSGYCIKDMRVVDNTCWFCGQKWWNTGQLIYNMDGTSYWQRNYCGFIGRFNISDVYNGSGNYEIITLDSVYTLTRMDAYNNGAVAVGESWKHKSCMIELYANSFGTAYHCRMNTPNLDEEVFMDIVKANNRIVTLSRFNNPNYYFHYHALFGLRYGAVGNYGATTNTLYRYDTYYIFGDDEAYFTAVEPIFLAHTNKTATDVTVSYIVTYYSSILNMQKRMITYHIIGEGTPLTEVLFNNDGQKYTKIKDIKFNYPITSNTHMTVLAEDTGGVSSLRFPKLNLGNTTYNDTSLKMSNPIVESVVPFQSASNDLNIFASGYYPFMSNKIAAITELNIHNHMPNWNTENCFSLSNGIMQSFGALFYSPNQYNSGLTQRYLGEKQFVQHPYTSSISPNILRCKDGTLFEIIH